MNIFSIRENRLGMTLVEMVISLVILSILTTSTMGMVISSNNIFISTSKSAIDKQVGNYAFDFLEKALRYTTHMSIYDSSAIPNDSNAQSVSLNLTDSGTNSGTLLYKRAEENTPYNLFENSFYGGRTLQYSVQKTGNKKKHIKLKVTVFRDGRAVYSRETIVKCLNLNLVTIGDGANPIVDKSSENSVNQTVTFTVDEQLLAGGKNAFSLEFKIADYMGRYNKIQNDYVKDLEAIQNKYINGVFNAEENPGITGTEDSPRKRIPLTQYVSSLSSYYRTVFGNGSPAFTRETDNVSGWNNIRGYYQNEILELLKFTPTFAGFQSGNIENVSVGGMSYLGHSGDEYYGVVATKEELYFGFMLTYYDKNGDGIITKAEYPQFEGDTFFDGTSMASYLKNTSDNQMVIMSYFKDNVELVNDNYADLVTTVAADVHTYTGNYMPEIVPAPSVSTTIPLAQTTSIPSSTSNFVKTGTVYQLFSDKDYVIDGESLLGYKINDTLDGETTHHYHGLEIENFLKNKLGAKNIIDEITYYTIPGSRYNNKEKVSYNAGADLTEGWYFIKIPFYKFASGYGALARNTRYCFNLFYISAAQTSEDDIFEDLPLNPDKIAVQSSGKIEYSFTGDASVPKQYYKLNKFVYPQARFTGRLSNDGEEISVETSFKSFRAHQYTDYVLYGVDWNSWFKASPQGLLNRLISGISNFVSQIMGRPINTNITSLSAQNAVQSLGNRGQHNINTIDRDIASYNLAWVVYNPKRGTWYYIPAKSNRLSSAVSNLSWSSLKDDPAPLNVDLDKGTWAPSSSGLISDIEQRKLSGSAVFGLVNTRTDILWVALPTGNTIDPNTLPDQP